MKAKIQIGLSAVLAAICWLSLCLDWDMIMYLSGSLSFLTISGECLPSKKTTKQAFKSPVARKEAVA